MLKIFTLIILMSILSACQIQSPQKPSDNIISNQYNFYQNSIEQAQKAQNQLENTSLDIINEE